MNNHDSSKPVDVDLATLAPPSCNALPFPTAAPPSDTPAPFACPQCGAEVHANDRFCEGCGHVLAAALGATLDTTPMSDLAGATAELTEEGGTLCVHCEEGRVDSDGYCLQCGRKQPDPRDHLEHDLDWLAGVSDKGLRHHRNEDSMAMQVTPEAVVMVVCDGVTSSLDPQIASRIAAETTCATIVGDLAQGRNDLDQIMADAVHAAQDGVAAVAGTTPEALSGSRGNRVNAPSCTWAAAVIRNGYISAASVGDSRVYLVGPNGNERLTVDDSWAAEVVAAGMMSEEVAELQPQAHAITGWLGADAPPIRLKVRHQAAHSGLLLVCSDGLWNYASAVDDMARVATDAACDAQTLLDRVRNMVRFAIDEGGHDNITVAATDLTAIPEQYMSPATDGRSPHLTPDGGSMAPGYTELDVPGGQTA